MVSQFGSLILLQTDAPISQPAWRCEGAQEFANGYRESVSWLEPPRHRSWAELPDYGANGGGLDWVDLPPSGIELPDGPPAGARR
jgi:hypothetical protein